MANDLVITGVAKVAKGLRLDYYAYVPVASPMSAAGGGNVIPTPYTTGSPLPQPVLDAWVGEAAKISALDAGDAIAVSGKYIIKDATLATLQGLTPQQKIDWLNANVPAVLPTVRADAISAYNRQYRYAQLIGLVIGL
jgi:hypothetical protein